MRGVIARGIRRLGLLAAYDRARDAARPSASRLPDVFGNRFYVDPTDIALEYFRLRNTPELPTDGELGFIARNVKSGQTVIDIGANVGLFTLVLARLVGQSGRVISFEPGPKAYPLLAKNVRANGYTKVRAENAAICDRTGTIDLFVCPTGESDNRISGTLDGAGNRERRPVPCFALDGYLGSRGIESVDFIKLDVQGAEFMALRGMEKTLRSNTGIQLLVEYSPDAIVGAASSPTQFLSYLTGLGFRLFNVGSGPEEPVTPEWLLENIGGPNKPSLTNLALRR